MRERLEQAAAEWERLGRARDALWSARQLDEADRVRLSRPRRRASARSSIDRGARSRRRRWARRGAHRRACRWPSALIYGGVAGAEPGRGRSPGGRAHRPRRAPRSWPARDAARRVGTARARARPSRSTARQRDREAEADLGLEPCARQAERGRARPVEASRLSRWRSAQIRSATTCATLLGEVLYERAAARRARRAGARSGRAPRSASACYDPTAPAARRGATPATSICARPGRRRGRRVARYEDARRARSGSEPARARRVAASGRRARARARTCSPSRRPAARRCAIRCWPGARRASRAVDRAAGRRRRCRRASSTCPRGRSCSAARRRGGAARLLRRRAAARARRPAGYLIGRHEATYRRLDRVPRRAAGRRARQRARRARGARVGHSGGLRLVRERDRRWTLHSSRPVTSYTRALGRAVPLPGRDAARDAGLAPVPGHRRDRADDAEAYAAWLDRDRHAARRAAVHRGGVGARRARRRRPHLPARRPLVAGRRQLRRDLRQGPARDGPRRGRLAPAVATARSASTDMAGNVVRVDDLGPAPGTATWSAAAATSTTSRPRSWPIAAVVVPVVPRRQRGLSRVRDPQGKSALKKTSSAAFSLSRKVVRRRSIRPVFQ